MKIKILTHIIRLSDGHVMPDWISVPASNSMEKEAEEINNLLEMVTTTPKITQ